ncbi:MAG: virulence protein [Christensenellales bacterium]|jgi:hypothetical protein
MRLSYNVKGAERKSLVAAISQELNAPTKYLGAPTFAYEVGGCHIDKNGTVTGPDNLDLEDALQQAGFNADGDSRHYDEPDTYESGLGGMGALDELPDIDQHHPGQYPKPDAPLTETMQKQIDEVIAFEDLQMDGREELGLGRTRRENFQGENGMRADDIPEPDELVIEMPLTGFTPEKLDNLAKLVYAKAPLLKAALGTDDLPIKQTADTLQFPWFKGTIDAEHTEAYATLVSLLCKTAIEKKRITAKEKDTDGNPKYAMRCFLLSLGFIGDEYKASRKILLSGLEGNSSWKGGKKTEVADSE